MAQAPDPEQKKVVFVGDGAVGKTSLVMAFGNDEVPTEHLPTIFDAYEVAMIYDGEGRTVELVDTAGQEDPDFARLRLIAYDNADVVILCFDLTQPNSFKNIPTWLSEIRSRNKSAKVALIGNKMDLRDSNNYEHIDPARGKRKAGEIKAIFYKECSAMTKEGVKEALSVVFQHAFKHKSSCPIL